MLSLIIDNVDVLLACLLEMALVMICIFGIFKEKIKLSLEMVLLIIFECIIMFLANIKWITPWWICLIYILLLIYCFRKFKRKFWETVGYFVLSFVIVGLVEIVSSLITLPFTSKISNENVALIVVNLIGIALGLVIFKIVETKKKNSDFALKKWKLPIAVCVLYVGVVIIDYRIRGEVDQIYSLLFLVACVLVVMVYMKNQATKHELELKNLEWEIREIYAGTYEELLSEVRKKQHDYEKQLSAVYSMCMLDNPKGKTNEEKYEYTRTLLEDKRYDKILTGCNNQVLAGYLYYKCVAYERSNVFVNYQLHVDQGKCCLSLHEIIELLGILLSNAFECCTSEKANNQIEFSMQETSKNLEIEVSNASKELSSKELELLFQEGYSSKGENRGIGLARVKQLIKRSNSDIIVGNRKKGTENWLNFKVIIPKREGE